MSQILEVISPAANFFMANSLLITIVLLFFSVGTVLWTMFQVEKYKYHIRLIDLFNMSILNVMAKPSRTIVTVGGVAIGIGAITFLVSVGYGLQALVISESTKLGELRQINIETQAGSGIVLDDKTAQTLANMPHIEKILPEIAVVANAYYNGSTIPVPAYGVMHDYLNESVVQPIAGELFTNNDQYIYPENTEEVGDVSVTVAPTPTPATETAIIKSGDEYVEVSNVDSKNQTPSALTLPTDLPYELVVNQSFLRLLGISESEAIGETVTLTLTATDLVNDQINPTTIARDYVIKGVVPQNTAARIYLPLTIPRAMGVNQFSQIKVILDDQGLVPTVRTTIESLGYITSSVQDTLNQIDSMFQTVRLTLGLIGVFGLAISALGMFNTLTVSLLERTREVGFMKAIGMKSQEVRQLFLIESLIIGCLGGIVGLGLGYILGKILSIGLTSYSLARGGGAIDVSVIPVEFGLLVISLSLFVGYITGFMPARRATKISSLDALRYE